MLSWYFKPNLLSRILIGLVLGAIVGIALGYGNPETVKAFVDNTKFFGDLFIRLLKMIVVPVILFSLIAGAASIAPSRLGRVGVKIMAYYLATSALAVAIALALAFAVHLINASALSEFSAAVRSVNGQADLENSVPYGNRYFTTTGYNEIADANDIIVLYPQAQGRDDGHTQNPDGCWDWWGYTSQSAKKPDYYSKNAIQIQAIYRMLQRLGGQ